MSTESKGTVAEPVSRPIQEFETVVKETQFNSSSRIVIDQEEIQKSHAKTLTSLLASQANISIAQSNFTPTSIYLRGGDSSHVLILIDGVPFYDASTIQRTINLNSIDIKSVQKIEVIKGSQSVIYGGQALSGVIKIETIPKELKNEGQVTGQMGSFNQSSSAAGLTQVLENNSAVVVRASYSQKEAASPVLDSSQKYPTRLGTGELAYINRNSKVQYLLKAQTSFDKTLISTTDFPAYSAADADRFETSTYQFNVTGFAQIPTSFFKPILSLSAQQSARIFEQDYFAANGSPTKQDYKGELISVRYDMTLLDHGPLLVLKGGSNFNREKMIYKDKDVLKSDDLTEFEGFFIKSQSQVEKYFNYELGFRSDFNQMKNKIDTFQVGLTLLEEIKIEYSTGFKQPSLFQLFSDYGNSNLEPEKSVSFSVSIDHQFSNAFYASYTVFANRFENLIIIRGSPQKYENVQSSDNFGHELSFVLRDLEKALVYNLAIGYQEPYDYSQKTWLVRRPLRTASLKIHKDYENSGLGLEVIHNGDRRDRTGSARYGTISSYTLVNLISDYKVQDDFSVFARIQNLANQKYESSYGFYDEGINASTGFEYQF
jgi:iron complex outermembrane receptor protein/vitamin B12 transporter